MPKVLLIKITTSNYNFSYPANVEEAEELLSSWEEVSENEVSNLEEAVMCYNKKNSFAGQTYKLIVVEDLVKKKKEFFDT
jgi:hypothetical protein